MSLPNGNGALSLSAEGDVAVPAGLGSPIGTIAAASIVSAAIQLDKELMCPVCHDVIKEAFMARCGHSFCYMCITRYLESVRQECPLCRKALDREGIYPNFTLNTLLERHAVMQRQIQSPPIRQLQGAIQTESTWNVTDINTLLGALLDKKRRLVADERDGELDVLIDFFQRARGLKEEQISRLQAEHNSIMDDLRKIEEDRAELVRIRDAELGLTTQPPAKRRAVCGPHDDGSLRLAVPVVNGGDTNNGASSASSLPESEGIAAKKRRVHLNFDDLQQCYFDTRQKFALSGHPHDALTVFSDCLSNFTRFSKFRVLASLKYGDIFGSNNIVSSIEFDRDDEFFATAGVTKKIKIFEYETIMRDPSDIHYPMREMACQSKISCLSWNSYIKSQIANSDYDGIISIWDAYTGTNVVQFEEHEKRAWSVDFSRTDPTRLASGSDDTRVKIWSTNQEHSVATIESKANICCVRFNPGSSNHLAFGSADHHIHYYDLRKLREPLIVFKGHRKAVSYVRFLNGEEIVSASTDSTLKLWNVSRNECVRTFSGHANDKNFVGLTANGDYVACGSENNAVYAYYKGLSKPVVNFKFGSTNAQTGEEAEDEGQQFVSSVCWKKNSNVLLAANSQGTIKAMELM